MAVQEPHAHDAEAGPARAKPRRRRSWLVVSLAGLVALTAAALTAARPRFRTEEVTWTSGGATIAGTLYLPRGEGPHPAAAFVPGYGDWTRDGQIFRLHAERLAARGLAFLIYDKRGCGASSGDWESVTLAELGDDALGGFALLRSDPRIRADAVGLLGTSQGGNVAVLAAAREPAVAFVATLSFGVLSPAEHAAEMAGDRVRRAGHGEAAAAAAEALQRRVTAVYRDDAGWEEARAEIDALEGSAWLADSGVELLPRASPEWRALRDLPLDHDPLALLADLAVPVFAAQGADDELVRGAHAARAIEEVARAHGRDVTVVLVPDAEHTLRRAAGFGPFRRWVWPKEYWEALDAWLARVTGDSPARE